MEEQEKCVTLLRKIFHGFVIFSFIDINQNKVASSYVNSNLLTSVAIVEHLGLNANKTLQNLR